MFVSKLISPFTVVSTQVSEKNDSADIILWARQANSLFLKFWVGLEWKAERRIEMHKSLRTCFNRKKEHGSVTKKAKKLKENRMKG